MRDIFKGYIPLSDDEKKNLVDEAKIVVDTNVLLDLYRYRTSTSQLYLELLEKVSDRLWLPHHVGFEFLKNRGPVRAAATSSHAGRLKLLAGWKDEILQAEKRSHVGQDEAEKDFLESLDQYTKHLNGELREIEAWSSSSAPDSILNRILNLFDQRTGAIPSEAWTRDAEAAGKKRAEAKIPPGFKDANKPENPYGDYFIWQQVIDYAAEYKTDILLVTGDVKEDWWQRSSGKTIGPLPALTAEFMRHTGQRLHMYDTVRFFDVLSAAGKPNGASKDDVQSARDDIANLQDARNSTHFVWHSKGDSLGNWLNSKSRLSDLDTSTFESLLKYYSAERSGHTPQREPGRRDAVREAILESRFDELQSELQSVLDSPLESERRHELENDMLRVLDELKELRERRRRRQNDSDD